MARRPTGGLVGRRAGCPRKYEALVDESQKIGAFGHGFTYSGHSGPAAVAL